MADLNFYFDPVCPFAQMTATWVRTVRDQRDYEVEWRFISLRLMNADVDYEAHFPPEYEAGHTSGLRLLRVAAAARSHGGHAAVDRLYETYGRNIWESEGIDWPTVITDLARWARPVLEEADLPPELADEVDNPEWDAIIGAETDEALGLTGKDVGTPILHVEPPHGLAFFGPVISRQPSAEQAVELWDHVLGLAKFAGFAELKRSLRELPQLPALGVGVDEIGKTEDWHGGSRRLKK